MIELTVTRLLRATSFLSLTKFKRFLPDSSRGWFMEVYVLLWATALVVALNWGNASPLTSIFIAAYRIFDILNYRLYYFFVKSSTSAWEQASARRSFIMLLLNVTELIFAYAVLYRWLVAIENNGHIIPLTATEALYFSVTTITTVGFGDFVPSDDSARRVVILEVASGFMFLAMLLPWLVSIVSSKPKK